MVKEMLSVMMDEIKDANMMLDYAMKAKIMNDDTFDWFISHARVRADMLMDDYKRINMEIGLEQKAMEGDMVAEALRCHLKDQITEIRDRMSMM